jgi:hypothetical protein
MNAPHSKISLYEIGQQFAALEELIDAQQGVMTESEADVVERWFAELEGTLEDKLRNCIAWARDHEAFADAAAGEAKRLLDLARVRRNRVERLKQMILDLFAQQGIKKIDTQLGPVRRVKNGGKAPILGLETIDVAALPEDCKRVVVEPVKDAIRARIEAGEKIGDVRIGERAERVELG